MRTWLPCVRDKPTRRSALRFRRVVPVGAALACVMSMAGYLNPAGGPVSKPALGERGGL